MAPRRARTNERTVAFLDVLGFKAMVIDDFDTALDLYIQILIRTVREQRQNHDRRRDIARVFNRLVKGGTR